MPAPGVAYQAGVVLSTGAEQYVARLRDAVSRSIVPTITVTSGSRTLPQQASAMLKKYQAGGSKELYDVYGSDATITKLLAAPKTVAAWTSVLEAELARGVRISRHVIGNTSPGAIDLHTKTLSSVQVAAIKKGVEKTGGRALVEAAPPHMHVDLPAWEKALEVAEQGAEAYVGVTKKVFPWVLGGTAAVALALVFVGLGRRRRVSASSGVP